MLGAAGWSQSTVADGPDGPRLVRGKVHAAPALWSLFEDSRDAGIDVTRLAVLVQRVVPWWKKWVILRMDGGVPFSGCC